MPHVEKVEEPQEGLGSYKSQFGDESFTKAQQDQGNHTAHCGW